MLDQDHTHPARRGGAPNLTTFVTAAVTLADRSGIEAVSLRRVCAALGSGTSSFYRVFESRKEMIDHMVDSALGGHVPPLASGVWRTDLAVLARSRRAMLGAHPWLGAELAGRPAVGPNALIHYERALGAAAGYSADPTTATSAVETVLSFVLGATVRETAEVQIEQRSGLTEEQWLTSTTDHLRQALASGEFPHLERALDRAINMDPDQRFERGITCILNGLAASGR